MELLDGRTMNNWDTVTYSATLAIKLRAISTRSAFHTTVDVVEATNAGTFGTQSTLHTSKGCSMGVKRKETGTVDGIPIRLVVTIFVIHGASFFPFNAHGAAF
jgi:hypothetical protein